MSEALVLKCGVMPAGGILGSPTCALSGRGVNLNTPL